MLIVDLCIFNLLGHHLFILKCFLGCDWKCSLGLIQNVHTYLLPPQVSGRSCWGFLFCYCTCSYQLIDWLKVHYIKVLIFIFVQIFIINGRINTYTRALMYKSYHQERLCLQIYCHQYFLGRYRYKTKVKKGFV